MRSVAFIAVVLASGLAAGIIYGIANFAIVEPYLDDAISIENQNLFATGQEDTPEFWVEYGEYRTWQKGGQVLASMILGVSIGALFGIVYVLSRSVLPGNHDIKKALALAGVMWLVLFMVPFLKYPANPPTVGDADTVELRSMLYLAAIAFSGLSALGFYFVSRKMNGSRRLLAGLGYCIVISGILWTMPENPDENTAPVQLLEGFRVSSVLAVSAYWIALPLILGMLWNKIRPDKRLAAAS